MEKTLIIVPAYNEESVIGDTLQKLMKVKEKYQNVEVCVVNDGSKDATAQIVKTFNVVLVDLPQNLGIGGAVQTGYKYAYENGYEIALQFDADGQHNIEDFEKIVEPILKKECDMVIGSRFAQKTDYKGTLARRIGIFYFSFLINVLTKNKITDPTSGYRAKNRKVIELFCEYYPKDYPEPEVIIFLHRKKLKTKEVSVRMSNRQGGVSSITPLKSIYYMGKVSLSAITQKMYKG